MSCPTPSPPLGMITAPVVLLVELALPLNVAVLKLTVLVVNKA
jgi:hypothetical protein